MSELQEEYELYLEWKRQQEREIDEQNYKYARQLEYQIDWLQDHNIYADDDTLTDWIFDEVQS